VAGARSCDDENTKLIKEEELGNSLRVVISDGLTVYDVDAKGIRHPIL
jgi:hypothetical protein